jgi:hypothetical protein
MIVLYIATCFGCSLLGYIYGKYEYTEFKFFMPWDRRLIELGLFVLGLLIGIWITNNV